MSYSHAAVTIQPRAQGGKIEPGSVRGGMFLWDLSVRVQCALQIIYLAV